MTATPQEYTPSNKRSNWSRLTPEQKEVVQKYFRKRNFFKRLRNNKTT